jgi:hypothetical protein
MNFFDGTQADQATSSIDELSKITRYYSGQARSKKQKRSVMLSFGDGKENGNSFVENVKVSVGEPALLFCGRLFHTC